MYNLISVNFDHHRNGWRVAHKELEKMNTNKGLLLYEWADWEFREEKEIKTPWIGILHNVLHYPENELPHKYNKNNSILPLSKLIKKDSFLKSLKNCSGLFTLCQHTSNFLKANLEIEVCNLWHPITEDAIGFNRYQFQDNPKVVMIGQWMRRYKSLHELVSPYKKIALTTKGFEKEQRSSQNVLEYLSNDEYDHLLASSIVFLDMYDIAACNTVLECIVRNTPLLINKLPAAIEYLGSDYPFFFENLNEAADKLCRNEIIIETHEYLKRMSKDHLAPNSFRNQFETSKIMKKITRSVKMI